MKTSTRVSGAAGGGVFRHPVDPALSPRLAAQAARDGVYKVINEMADRGALDAGNGDVLDAWIDSLRPQWIAHHVMDAADREAAAQLAAGEYEATAAAARARAEATKAEQTETERLLAIYEQRLLTPNEAPAMSHPDRRRRPRPSLDALEGLTPHRSWKVISVLLLLLAAAGDLASFYITLAGLTAQAAWMVWTLTVAFTAAAVGVMHVVGRTARNLREGQGGLGRTALTLMTLAWLALGAAAFYVRTQVTPPSPATTIGFGETADPAAAAGNESLLSAILLAALFVGSGILAFCIGFSDHQPRMQTFLALRSRVRRLREDVATAEAEAIQAARLAANARDEITRTDTRRAAAEESVDAEIAELKELARLHIAGLLGQPAATNNLTTGRSAAPSPPPSSPAAGPVISTQNYVLEAAAQAMSGNGHGANGNGHSANGAH